MKLANRHRIPIAPRAGGTGLNDGALPLKRGIVVDVKLMNQIKELDLVDRTVTVGPGINMLKLNEELRKHGVMYPDDPASYPCSLVGGRIGTSGWSLIGGRYGHTRDLVISFQIVLPTGEIIEVGEGGGRKIRKILVRLPAEAPVHGPPGHARDRDRGDPRARAATGGRVRGVLPLPVLRGRLGVDRQRSPPPASRPWLGSSCSTSGSCATCAATTRPTSLGPTTSRRSWQPRCTAPGTRSSRRRAG